MNQEQVVAQAKAEVLREASSMLDGATSAARMLARMAGEYEAMVDAAVVQKPVTQTQSGCDWSEDADGNWSTGCHQMFVMLDGKPSENGFKFCSYCGKAMVEHAYDVEVAPI